MQISHKSLRINTMSTRIVGSVHFAGSVLFGMDPAECTDHPKCTDTCQWYILQHKYISDKFP